MDSKMYFTVGQHYSFFNLCTETHPILAFIVEKIVTIALVQYYFDSMHVFFSSKKMYFHFVGKKIIIYGMTNFLAD
jgi:hypothetical protein